MTTPGVALIGLVIEADLWGTLAMIAFLSAMLPSAANLNKHRRYFVPLSLLFVLCTFHLILAFNDIYSSAPESSRSTYVLLKAKVLAPYCSLLAQALLVYRTWIVWGRYKPSIIIPSGFLVLTFMFMTSFARENISEDARAILREGLLVAGSFLTSLLLFLQTGYSVKYRRALHPQPGRPLKRALVLIAETGYLSVVAHFVAVMVAMICSSVVVQAVHAALVPVFCIVPMLTFVCDVFDTGKTEEKDLDDGVMYLPVVEEREREVRENIRSMWQGL